MSDLAWAIRPKWHRFESPRSYSQRQCDAVGLPFEFVERGLTSAKQPNVNRVWGDDIEAAKVVEAAAGRPAGHYQYLKDLAQPDPFLAYEERFLCRLCASGDRVEQIPHDRENWCLRHSGQMVWAGPGTTPETQTIVVFDREQASAERTFRRLVATRRVDKRLHTRAWEMVRDNAWLTRPQGWTEALARNINDREVYGRACLFPETVAVLAILSNPSNVQRWRDQQPAAFRNDVTNELAAMRGPVDVLVERIVLWMRPLRRESRPTRINPLEVPLDLVDATAIIDTTALYPKWIQRHPRAVTEWDWSRNDPSRDPWDAAAVSRKAWWVCDQGHSWETKPIVRGQAESSCPYCVSQDVWPGHTDLATVHPELAVEWDSTTGLNSGDPSHVSPRSSRNIIWKCSAGHGWVASIANRSKLGSGCPACAGKRAIPGETDLATLRPDIAAQWDPERNGAEFLPSSVTVSSSRKAWWKCTLGHTWRATVDSRTRKNASGCPYCANKAVLPGFNDLTTTHPALAAEWDHGNTTTAQQVTAGSSTRAAWRCKAGHVWRVAISSRAGRRTGCPYCSNKAVLAGFNDLATMNPDLAAEWDGTIGANDRTPSDVTPRSDYRASWKCDRGHIWQASVSNRGAGNGCPYCCGRRVIPGETDLATIRPDLAAEWDPENALTPDQATPSSHRKVSWRCEKGHFWQATIANRSNGHGCPYCAGSRVIPGETDLATLRPDLAAEWAPLNALTPQEVSISSNRRVLWKCDAGHMWEAVISTRTRTKCTGCPHCAGRCNVPVKPAGDQ